MSQVCSLFNALRLEAQFLLDVYISSILGQSANIRNRAKIRLFPSGSGDLSAGIPSLRDAKAARTVSMRLTSDSAPSTSAKLQKWSSLVLREYLGMVLSSKFSSTYTL